MRAAINVLLVAALCVQLASGTVLVRFINTVPNTLETPTAFSQADNIITPNRQAAADLIARSQSYYELGSTRVGLKYSASLTSPSTTVWTEPNTGFASGDESTNDDKFGGMWAFSTTTAASSRVLPASVYAYKMAMPPLRAYHASGIGGTLPTSAGTFSNSVDRIAHYQQCMGGIMNSDNGDLVTSTEACYGCSVANGCDASSQTVDASQAIDNASVDPSVWDTMDHYGLKADGISQYLTFAAGTYSFSAYGVGGSQQYPADETAGSGGTSTSTTASTAISAAQAGNTGSTTPVTGGTVIKGRTVINFPSSKSDLSFVDGHTYTIVARGSVSWPSGASQDSVQLSLIDESVAPATFGKASIRFFHAIQSMADATISVSNGVEADAASLASGLAFGTVSEYVDVAPATSQVNQVTSSDGDTEESVSVTADLRAGTRATIICAVNDLTVAGVFCRQIPSRVVAYVRLVNDYEDVDNHVGSGVALKDTEIALWGSYDFPKPNMMTMGSTDVSLNVNFVNPIASTGLYPVIGNTKAGTVTGYGEVHVPLFIMDKAVSRTIFMSGNGHAYTDGMYSVATKSLGSVGYTAGWDGSIVTATGLIGGGVSSSLTNAGGTALMSIDTVEKMNAYYGMSSDVFTGFACYQSVATGNTGASVIASNQGASTSDCGRINILEQGYDYAARYKRVNLLVRTSIGGTINDMAVFPDGHVKASYATNFKAPHLFTSSTDIPMEPGQFYTFYATVQLRTSISSDGTTASGDLITPTDSVAHQAVSSANFASGTGSMSRDVRKLPAVENNQDTESTNTAGTGTLLVNPANGRIIEFGLSLDRSIDDLAVASETGKGYLRFMPFGMVSEAHALSPNGLIGLGDSNTIAVTEFSPYAASLGVNGVTGANNHGNAIGCDIANKMTAIPATPMYASAHYDISTVEASQLMSVVHLRQFHNAYGTFAGDTGPHVSHSSPPQSKLPYITILDSQTNNEVETKIDPLSNYVRLDPLVLYMPTLKPMWSNTITLDAGTYTWKVDSTDWALDECVFTVPPKDIDLKAGDYLTVFVLNFYGCRSTSSNADTTSKLNTVVAAQVPYSMSPAEAAATETFFGAASSVSASMALLVAGVIAIFGMAL